MELNFGTFIEDRIARLGLSQQEFSRRCGEHAGEISLVRTGQRRPPKNELRLMRWARALGLSEVETEFFLELADLERTPMRIRRRYVLQCLAARV